MSARSIRRGLLSQASLVTVDQLERRQFLSNTPWLLSSGSLIQNWENTSQITTANDWSGVPSIEGYRRDRTTATNTDPQTILVDTGAVLNVLANQTAVQTNGGLQEITLASPISVTGSGTVGMQGSGTADDVFLKFYLNNSGRSVPVRVKYDLIDVDAEANATVQQSFALQYRLASSGTWVNVPAGYILNAADGTNGSTGLTNSFDVTLPNDTINASTVEVRIMTTDSVGADQLVAVDNIRVFGADVFAFQPASYSVVENVGTLQLTVKRIGDLNGTASVNYNLVNGTATSPSDFTAASGTLTFADQVDTATITVTIVNNAVSEPTESFTAVLSSPSAGFALGANSTATISITDDDAPLPTVVLNEIKVNPPDLDGGNEYVELLGTASTSLANVYFVSIEGDGTASGTADMVVDLSSYSLGTNGFLLLAAAGTSVPSGTTLATDPDFAIANGILENGSNSFAIIYSLTPINEGTDYDIDGDGALELPVGSVIIDAVGSTDLGVGDIIYGAPLFPPAGSFEAATRLVGDLTPNSGSAWYAGDLADPSLGSASETGVYDPRATNSTPNLPQGAILTPGSANFSTSLNAGQFVIVPISQAVDESVGTVTVNVYRAGGALGAASVLVSSAAGTATSGSDYDSFTQTLNFAAGEFLKSFTINITDDSLSEADETFGIQLSNATGATILKEGLGQVIIRLNDAAAPTGLLLNELDVNPPGTDAPFEYVELRGQSSTTLVNVYLLSIEGSGTAAGTLDAIINLSGAVIGSNGLLMIKSPTGGFTPLDGSTGVFTSTLFDGAGIENDSNSVLLVFVPIGISLPSTGTDLDSGNTGTLALDGSIVVLDAVATLDPDVGDIGYGGAVLPAFTGTSGDGADAMVRFPNDTDAADATAWYYGNLDTTGTLQSQTAFSTTQVSGNFPVGGALTPGAVNAPSGDTIAPTVSSSVFNFLTGSAVQQNIVVTFSEDVGASLAASDFTLVNTDNNAVISLTLANVTTTSGITTATLTFSGTGNSLGGSILTDGHYRIRVLAGQVADAAGNVLAANSDTTFAFKNADFDGDLDVDFDNLLTLAQNFGGTGKTFAQGDVNYDGTVNFDDLLALAQRFGTSLFSVKPIAPATKSAARKAPSVIA